MGACIREEEDGREGGREEGEEIQFIQLNNLGLSTFETFNIYDVCKNCNKNVKFYIKFYHFGNNLLFTQFVIVIIFAMTYF